MKFPAVFWVANITELIERSAYYSIATFVVIYLGELGLGSYWPAILNTLLWFLIYFLPVLSGSIADQIGYRRALLGACVLLMGGYGLLGYPVWAGAATLATNIEPHVTAGAATVAPAVLGIVLIGCGGSIVKPCILGTTQKTAGGRATLAYATFFLVVNIGALAGRGAAYYVRTRPGSDLTRIFAVAAGLALVALMVVAGFYREPQAAAGRASGQPRRSPREVLAGITAVVTNGRFCLFLLVSCGFYFLYNQFYVSVPLYLKTVVEASPAMDTYTMLNPVVIVCFQLLITRLFGKLNPVRSMMIGVVIMGAALALNLLPLVFGGDVRAPVAGRLPLGSLLVVVSFGMCAFAELFSSPRMYEYIGAMAPKGKEGLFLGYANLPLALGSLAGGPLGALIFNQVMTPGAAKRADGLLDLVPGRNAAGWTILLVIALVSAVSLWFFDRRFVSRRPEEGAPVPAAK